MLSIKHKLIIQNWTKEDQMIVKEFFTLEIRESVESTTVRTRRLN